MEGVYLITTYTLAVSEISALVTIMAMMAFSSQSEKMSAAEIDELYKRITDIATDYRLQVYISSVR